MALTMDVNSIISGTQAECYVVIGKNKYNFAQATKAEAKIEINKTELGVLGKTNKLHKPAGWKGTGTATFRYNTSIFRDMMVEFKDKSQFVYFDMKIKNLDPQTQKKTGYQEVTLKNCCLDNGILAKFDIDSEALDEDISFTFDDYEVNRKFKVFDEMKL